MEQRTITIKELSDALGCTETNIRDREGKSIPKPISERPRVYKLSDVLWIVCGQDREAICKFLQISVNEVRTGISRAVETTQGYVPDSLSRDDGEDDVLMH